MLAWARKLASLLLAVCFFLPLSTCTTRVEFHGTVAVTEAQQTGYKLTREGWNTAQAGHLDGANNLLVVLEVFFLPLLCWRFPELPQAIAHVVGALPAGYYLFAWVFLFSTSSRIGGWIAILCWAFLFVSGIVTMWTHWRRRAAAVRAQS
jgi:hypothetical protein